MRSSPPPRPPASAPQPLTERELDELEQLLDRLPAPLEPLDISMLDGFITGVLLQPQPVPEAQWLRHVHDIDGRDAPPKLDLSRLQALARRRHAEVEHAIAQRQWFDPWVWELEEDAEPAEVVMPWVAGFATAMEFFPGLMRLDSASTLEPLALLYASLDPEDLEDADELLAEIETLEPPEDLTEAVEILVRASLLLADVSRPLQNAPAARKAPAKRAAAKRPPPRRGPPPRR